MTVYEYSQAFLLQPPSWNVSVIIDLCNVDIVVGTSGKMKPKHHRLMLRFTAFSLVASSMGETRHDNFWCLLV